MLWRITKCYEWDIRYKGRTSPENCDKIHLVIAHQEYDNQKYDTEIDDKSDLEDSLYLVVRILDPTSNAMHQCYRLC